MFFQMSISENSTRQIMQRPCHRHLKRVESFIFPRSFRPFIPICDSEGYYLALQCHQSSGYCWCVSKSGNMKAGTRTKGNIDCGTFFSSLVSSLEWRTRHRSYFFFKKLLLPSFLTYAYLYLSN